MVYTNAEFDVVLLFLQKGGEMRMSCNGCRVLRKGCSESCALRPCLQWIRSAESQANATIFLAKFYGRSGLMKLLNSGAEHLKPIIFRSLLYEACGRIANPIYGSVGLHWSGNWHICQAAVESVLNGQHPLMHATQIADSASDVNPSHAKSKEKLLKVKSPGRFKRANRKPKTHQEENIDTVNSDEDGSNAGSGSQVCNLRWRRCYPKELEEPTAVTEPPGNLLSESSSESEFRGSRNYQVENTVCSTETSEPVGDRKEDEIENFNCKEEEDVELELRLGSPVSELRLHIPSYSHLGGIVSDCRDEAPVNITSLSLALS